MNVNLHDQRPSDGCNNCGKYAEEPEYIKRRRLQKASGTWLCYDCRRKEAKRLGVTLREL